MFGDSLGTSEIFEFCTNSNKIIVELGANDGYHSQEILNHMKEGDKLYCIEADSHCIGLHKNRINNDKCLLTHAAITDSDGEGIFHRCTSPSPYGNPVWHYASSLKPIKHGLVVNPWLRYEDDITVRYITLDSFAKENGIDHIDFIWCDVEGAYAEVVDGAKEILKRTRYFYTECEDVETYEGEIMYSALRQKMESIGWELVYRFRYDALFINMGIINE